LGYGWFLSRKLIAQTYCISHFLRWQAFQEEFESRRGTLNTLQQAANPEDPAVLQRLNTINDLWANVEDLSHNKEMQLADNLAMVSNARKTSTV